VGGRWQNCKIPQKKWELGGLREVLRELLKKNSGTDGVRGEGIWCIVFVRCGVRVPGKGGA